MIMPAIAILIFISLAILFSALYPLTERFFQSWHKRRMEKITPRLAKMFINIPQQKLLLIDIASPLAAGLLVFSLTSRFMFALAGALAGVTLSNFIIKQLELARRRKFSSQLVDALMLLAGSLKAGLSLIQAFESLVEEMPAPISQEFSLTLRENRMGVPLEECLVKLKQRVQCEELDMIVTAVLVARETGGDLTAIFSNLVMTIRESSRLLSRVKALCTQGQLQGRIMIFLPILFGFTMYKINPSFFETLLNDPMGKLLLAYAVFSEIIGAFLISRLSKIEI